jgi:glycosyltransferase involved in cell wall biosynthesis
MRLLELCLSPNFGGLEINFKDFCVWLAYKSDIDLYVATSNNSRIQQSLESENIKNLSISCKFLPFPLFSAITLSRFIDTNKIDVVHLHWKHDLPLVSVARKICKKHFFIVHTRKMDLPGGKHDIYHKFIYKEIDKYIVTTDLLKEQALRNLPLDANKIHRIYNGCNPPTHLSNDDIQDIKRKFNIESKFTIGVFGRMQSYKGQHLLIHAIDELCQEGLDIQGILVGHAMSNDYLQEMEDLIASRSLNKRVSLIPFQNDPTKIIQCLDALVLTTIKETFGIVLVEGMLAGIPVIGSNAGGVPEIIDHNETGLLFESGNTESLIEAIRTLYLDKSLKEKIAAAGKKKAQEKFDKNNQFKKILKELTFDRNQQ